MPTTFADLPPELLLPIFVPLPQSALISCSLVSHQWQAFAIPLLYRRVAVYSWHKKGKARAIALLHTLATRPDIARYVRYLDVRDFPRPIEFGPEQQELRKQVYEDCEEGLANCVNLRSCIWTRHETLTPSLLHALSRLPHLATLELNATCASYAPRDLLAFRRIESLALTMPDREAVNILPKWIEAIDEEDGLRSLSIICQSTTHITSPLLMSIAPNLTQLESLHLLGCAKADHTGISSILYACNNTLTSLGIESPSSAFDLPTLARLSPPLPRLTNLTLTLPPPPSPHQPFLAAVLALTASSPLGALTLALPPTIVQQSTSLVLYNPAAASSSTFSSTPPQSHPQFEPSFATALARQHARTLRKLSVARLPTPLEAIEILTALIPKLQTLIVPVHEFDWPRLIRAVAAPSLPQLRTLHLSYPTSPVIAPLPRGELLPLAALRALVMNCSVELEQVGQLNKVYEVVRRWTPKSVEPELTLERWTGPLFPEAFQVMRA